MKFSHLDFYILRAINSGKYTLSDMLVSACESLPDVPSICIVQNSLSKLSGSGYVCCECGKYTPTDKAKEIFVGKKLFEGKEKYNSRILSSFIDRQAQSSKFELSESEYISAKDAVRQMYEIRPTMSFCDGILTFIGEETECDEDCISAYTASFSLINPQRMFSDLLCVCEQLTHPGKAKKICIEATDASYVMTIRAENGALVLKAQKILFNRKRFSGKLNSDLDYAQCGETILRLSCSAYDLLECVALCGLEFESSFSESDRQNLECIMRLL